MVSPQLQLSAQAWYHQDDFHSQASEMLTQSEPMTQNELTQLALDEDSRVFSPASWQQPIIHPKKQPWGRLLPCSDDKESGGIDFLPREPTNSSRAGGVNFLGIEQLRPVDIFNEYILGRSSKCDVQAKPPRIKIKDQKEQAVQEWVHAMISNKHCKIFCMLKSPGPSQEMDVYIEDMSGNGTLINGTTLLRRGEKRLLHTGDEISLVNQQTMQKKIYSVDLLHALQRKHAFIFVNLFQQQQGRTTLLSHLHQKKLMITPPASSIRKKGLVNPKEMVNHSLDRFLHPRPFPISEGTNNTKRSPQKRDLQRRVETFYDIRDVLGSGTVGEVRRAIHRQSGEEFAVKIIVLGGRNRGVKLNDEASATLEAEASILQALNHPYVVKLCDIFVAPGVAIYLVMELLQGGDLFDRIVQKGSYTEVESRRVMRRLLNAVYYLHDVQNVVHRDLKPENILVVNRQSDIEIKLTDFGLAKSITEDGLKTFCGTPQYFAPEVLRRRHTVAGRGRYGKQADMWSVGVILYILLSGAPPFDVSQGFEEVADVKIVFPESRWRGISKEAMDLIKKLLQTDPDKRITANKACIHEWILISDGDTHTHPLDDPAIRLFKDDESSTLVSKKLFESKELSVRISLGGDGFDDEVKSVNTRILDDNAEAPKSALESEKKSMSVEDSKKMLSCLEYVDHTTQSISAVPVKGDQATEYSAENSDQEKVNFEEKYRIPLFPVDLNQRSNYFRDIVAKSAEKTTPKIKSSLHKVVRLDYPSDISHEDWPELRSSTDEPSRMAVSPVVKRVKTTIVKVYGKRYRDQDERTALEGNTTAELTDDEICSQFTEEGDNLSSCGTSTVTAGGSIDKISDAKTAKASSMCLSNGFIRDIDCGGVQDPPQEKKQRTNKAVTPEGDKNEIDTPTRELKSESSDGHKKQQCHGKQTKLSTWLVRKQCSG